MYWTKTLIPTLKESPAEAEIVSHKLLLRAGILRKLTGGLYTFMPLGLRFQKKLDFQSGMIGTSDVDEILVVCRKGG